MSMETRTGGARLEGRQKVTGRARYTSDMELPGQLYAGVLRSPHARARLIRLDVEGVRRVPGVRDVLTPDDTEGITWYGEKVPILGRELRFQGDEVAAVVADTEEAVEDALRAFTVEYEGLRPVPDLEAAMREGAPLVHAEAQGNRVSEPETYERGDARTGLAQADVVVEAAYTTPTAIHNALEPHGCNAWWDGDQLNLWTSTQGIFAVRDGIAEALGLPLNQVRVHAQHVGGGFGAKQVPWKECALAALLARRTQRPVKLMLDREAENLAVGNRSASRQRVWLGARGDGTLCAIRAHIQVNAGAYSVAGEGSMVAGCFKELYTCANVSTEQHEIYTNTGPSVAFRGPGYVEGTFALEQAMDELARKLDMDPFELRERNYASDSQLSGKPYSSPEALRHCYRAVREAFGWSGSRHEHGSGRKRRGIGMAGSVWLAGGGNPPAYAEVDIQSDGSISLLTGTQDIGTGTRTVLAQLAATELGVPLARVRVELGDTATELRAPTSAGSATLPSVGPAVRAAAAEVKKLLLEQAAREFETRTENLVLEQGEVYRQDAPDQRLSLARLAAAAVPGSLRGRGSCPEQPGEVTLRTFAAHCAEVEVDMDTAEVTVLRLVCAPDCGRIVNRTMADSQVIGGVTQGLGFALTESRVVDPRSGVVLNANLEDYLVPTAADVPPIEHAAVDLPDYAANALGAKGLGEPPMIAVAPAIANAVYDAAGIRLRDLPMHRRGLLRALAATGDAS